MNLILICLFNEKLLLIVIVISFVTFCSMEFDMHKWRSLQLPHQIRGARVPAIDMKSLFFEAIREIII